MIDVEGDYALQMENPAGRRHRADRLLSATDDYIVVHDPAGRVVMFVDLVQPWNIPFRTLLGYPERIVERFQWIEDALDFDVSRDPADERHEAGCRRAGAGTTATSRTRSRRRARPVSPTARRR